MLCGVPLEPPRPPRNFDPAHFEANFASAVFVAVIGPICLRHALSSRASCHQRAFASDFCCVLPRVVLGARWWENMMRIECEVCFSLDSHKMAFTGCPLLLRFVNSLADDPARLDLSTRFERHGFPYNMPFTNKTVLR